MLCLWHCDKQLLHSCGLSIRVMLANWQGHIENVATYFMCRGWMRQQAVSQIIEHPISSNQHAMSAHILQHLTGQPGSLPAWQAKTSSKSVMSFH
jgi:hypothetical protein